jgi:hypothetical protein
MSLQKSPAVSGDQVSGESEGKRLRNCVKAAALAVLKHLKKPLTGKELADVVLERGLADFGLGSVSSSCC